MRIVLITVFAFSVFASSVFAQTQQSNEVQTRVGSPAASISSSSPALEKILNTASSIVGSLRFGSDGFTNVKPDEPGVYYWCTYLVADSYAAAGFTGFNRGTLGAVVNMAPFFANRGKELQFLDYRTGSHEDILKRVQPGFAMFFISVPGVHTGKEHVAIVKTVQIDAKGNGFIDTIDSNFPKPGGHYVVSGWTITNAFYPVDSFGGPR